MPAGKGENWKRENPANTAFPSTVLTAYLALKQFSDLDQNLCQILTKIKQTTWSICEVKKEKRE